ncbi:hypothetical protein [Haliangium ochraceum]|uniref:Uncharacterized protein n=1 Tax=Haliangium ochraceum (strain DSM 14365 / JCM 11303 / SMP-2) TaxID=502025 RepID=D0LMC1_HALO1|nr:hypothetical protein [Haliangium ochraceum]ACY16827.1 conserved hypothetical protein [Haliangium ochraceum DSM 14365]
MTNLSKAMFLSASALALLALAHARDSGAHARSAGADGASMPRLEAADGDFVGTVRERLPAGGYTYMDVRTNTDDSRWVVTLGEGEDAGQRVRVHNLGVRHDFHSARLERDFSLLVFGIVRSAN